MRRILSVLCAIGVMIGLVGCSEKNVNKNIPVKKSNDKLEIITTLFPQYSFAKEIVGEKANVTLLLDPGTESHSFSPSPADIIKISKADMFIYTSKYMETWAENLLSGIDNDNLLVVDASKNITLTKTHKSHDHKEDNDKNDSHVHNHAGFDPHIWTNPQFSITMVDNIEKALCEKDPDNADYYKENAKEYKEKLSDLDLRMEKMIKQSKYKDIYFGGRFAMTYFVGRYGLTAHSAFDSCTSQTEPSAKAVAKMISEMKKNNIKVVYYQELVEPKVANTMAKEVGAKTLIFHSAHNVSKKEYDKGISYLSIMEQNLLNLQEGLN